MSSFYPMVGMGCAEPPWVSAVTSREMPGRGFLLLCAWGFPLGLELFLMVERSEWDSTVVPSVWFFLVFFFFELKRPDSRPVLATLCVLEMWCNLLRAQCPPLVNEGDSSAYRPGSVKFM